MEQGWLQYGLNEDTVWLEYNHSTRKVQLEYNQRVAFTREPRRCKKGKMDVYGWFTIKSTYKEMESGDFEQHNCTKRTKDCEFLLYREKFQTSMFVVR
jgi:hypothetical protein